MHQKISDPTLEIIPDAAHAGIFEARDRSADVILRWAGAMM